LPVVNGEGALVGVFSQADLLFKEQGLPDSPSWLSWFVDPIAVADQRKLDAHVVGDAMTTPAQVIEQDSRSPSQRRSCSERASTDFR
jgi:hypothetical protein